MDASLRFWWDGGGYRRRQVHEQGLAACGVLEDGGRGDGGDDGAFPKRDTQGTGPLGGCGQSPPFSPRDGCENEAAAGRAGSFRRARSAHRPRPPVLRARLPALEGCARIRKAVFPVLPARLPALPERQTAPQRTFPRKPAKTRRATQQRLCPTGANSVALAPRSAPCPVGARQRRPTRRSSSPSSFLRLRRKRKTGAAIHLTSPSPKNRRRRQAPARGPAAVCSLHRPTRNTKKRPCPLLVGHRRVDPEPKALAGGTAGTARGPAAACALHHPTRNAKKRPCPLLVGHGRVDPEPTALAAGTAG